MRRLSEESRYPLRSLPDVPRATDRLTACRLDRITQAAEELSKGTGNTCIPAQADVRKPDELKEAVRKTIEKFGKIDFVICGEFKPLVLTVQCTNLTWPPMLCVGAAGNFLAPLSGLSENAYRTVIEIDTVRRVFSFYLKWAHL